MTASYLDEMAARAAECGILADCAEDPRIARWFRAHAEEIGRWHMLARKAELALDEIAESERQSAHLAEAQARAAQNPGRGPSPAANCPSTAPGACGPDRGTSPLRTIDSVIAAAHGDRVIALRRPALRIVLGDDMGPVA